MDAHYPGSVHNLCQYSRISKDILIAILIANSFLPSPEGGQHFFQLVPAEIVEQHAQICAMGFLLMGLANLYKYLLE